MTVRIAINGFGRIGRNVLRAIYNTKRHREINVVAINELASSQEMAYLLKYDTNYGNFFCKVHQEQDILSIEGKEIKIFHKKKINQLPWKDLAIDIVLDCTGVFGSRTDGENHIQAGAKKVIFSHPGSNDVDIMIVFGVNHLDLLPQHNIISNASCTINCIVPIIKIIDDAYEIEQGLITTIHSMMNDQQVTDSYNSKFRLNRAASQSIVPIDTKLAFGIERIFPKFSNRFAAISVRVPTINVSAIDLSVKVKRYVQTYEVNKMMKNVSYKEFNNVVDYTEVPLVSSDFNYNSHSAIIDGTQTKVSGNDMIKILVWCDNEWGFVNRMIDTVLTVTQFINK